MKFTRRKAIIGGIVGGGFLGVGFWFARERDRLGSRTLFNVKTGEAGLNGWIKISRDNSVIVAVPRAEMGQGVQTALAMLAAEEMDARWDQVRVEDPPEDGVYRNVDILVAGLRLVLEQRRRSHDEAGLAVAALGHLVLDPGALQGMQPPSTTGQAFDGGHRLAGDVGHGDRAGAHRLAIDMDRAGAADGNAAAELRPDDVQVLAQDPEQRLVRFGIDLTYLTVHGERDHRSIKVSPRTRTSILVRRKQSIASSGLQTTGSFSLKLVLSTMGTPVRSRNDCIRRA